MVELQILSKILNEKNFSILTLNGITDDYFITYQDEYEFIKQHYLTYHTVPDKETFLSKFPDFTILDVKEPDSYLIDTFNEEHLYSISVPVINKIAELMQTDSRAAVEYLQSQLPILTASRSVMGVDIISRANERLEEWKERRENKEKFCIPTGFDELDSITGGWQRGEEFAVIFARTGQGKSWLLIKTLEHAWKLGYRVGLVEPEMSANKTGYRFDTLANNISNLALLRGEEVVDYESYINSLTSVSKNPFFVAGLKDFKRKITVSKLRAFVEANKLDILGIDGISYLTDERKQKGDSRTVGLTNISEDLMDLSIDLKIPIIVVCQSNREGAKEEAPDLENIRDSDGIAYNASIIIALKQKGPGIELAIRKNRNGQSGDKLTYMWDIDKGIFKYVPDSLNRASDTEQVENLEHKFSDGTELF